MSKEAIIRNVNAYAREIACEFGIKIEKRADENYFQAVKTSSLS